MEKDTEKDVIEEMFSDVAAEQAEDIDEMISEMETVLTSQTKAIKNISKSQTQVLKKIKKWEDIALNGGFKNQEKLQEVRFIGVEFDYQKLLRLWATIPCGLIRHKRKLIIHF